jgi:hypothetical protein
MKAGVIAAVLISILLLVAGAASAADEVTCDVDRCYYVYKDCDNPSNEYSENARLCLNGNIGWVCFDGEYPGCLDVVSFGYSGGFNFDDKHVMTYVAGGHLNNSYPASFFFRTHGGYYSGIDGVGRVDWGSEDRCLIYGYRQDPSNCTSLEPGPS